MALLLVASMESYFREGAGRYWSPQSCSQALQLGTLDLELVRPVFQKASWMEERAGPVSLKLGGGSSPRFGRKLPPRP